MIANGFKPVGWVAAVGTAALGCYMLSLQVAAERADLASLDRRIVATHQQIRALQTELGTRGRLQQLEQWNEEVLALSAPVSGQYLQSNVQLARFSTNQPQPLDNSAEVLMASADVPAAAAPAAPAIPAPRHAVAGSPAVASPNPVTQPMVQRASLTLPPPAAPPPERASTPTRRPAASTTAPTVTASRETPARQASRAPATTTPVRVASAEQRPAPRREQAATAAARPRNAAPQNRSGALLDDRTMRELGATSRAERRGGTGD
jgi:hypothetical protein